MGLRYPGKAGLERPARGVREGGMGWGGALGLMPPAHASAAFSASCHVIPASLLKEKSEWHGREIEKPHHNHHRLSLQPNEPARDLGGSEPRTNWW